MARPGAGRPTLARRSRARLIPRIALILSLSLFQIHQSFGQAAQDDRNPQQDTKRIQISHADLERILSLTKETWPAYALERPEMKEPAVALQMVLIGEQGITNQGAFEQALLLGRAAKVLARFQNKADVEAEASYLIGRAALSSKQPQLAKANLLEALAHYKLVKNHAYAQDALLTLAGVALNHDSDRKLATSYYEEVIKIKDGDDEKVAGAHLAIGQILEDDNVDKAISHLQMALAHLKGQQGRKTAWAYGVVFGALTHCYLNKKEIALAQKSVEDARGYARLSGSEFLSFLVAIKEGDIFQSLHEDMRTVTAYTTAISVYKAGRWANEIEIGRRQDSFMVSDTFVHLDAWKAAMFTSIHAKKMQLVDRAAEAAEFAVDVANRNLKDNSRSLALTQLAYIESLRGNAAKAVSLRNAALSLVANDPKALEMIKQQLAVDGLIRTGLFKAVDPLTTLSSTRKASNANQIGPGTRAGNGPEEHGTLAATLKEFKTDDIRKAARSLRVDQHDAESAVRLLGAALTRDRQASNRIGEILTLEQLAWAFEDQGNSETALSHVENAFAVFEEMAKSDKTFLERFIEAASHEVSALATISSSKIATDPASMLNQWVMSPCTILAILRQGHKVKGSLAASLDRILSFRVATASHVTRHAGDLVRKKPGPEQKESTTVGDDFFNLLRSEVGSSEFQIVTYATVVLKFLESAQPEELSAQARAYFRARANLMIGEEGADSTSAVVRANHIRESLHLLDSIPAGTLIELDPPPAIIRIRALHCLGPRAHAAEAPVAARHHALANDTTQKAGRQAHGRFLLDRRARPDGPLG